jgi:sucrose-6-phosphate hydrolase SacC (GH32 family)
MITIHLIDDMNIMIFKDIRRRHEIFSNSEVFIDDQVKLLFLESIVEYNQHMSESDENAQQRSYYCLACKSQLSTLKRRRPLAEIEGNSTKRRRASQTM